MVNTSATREYQPENAGREPLQEGRTDGGTEVEAKEEETDGSTAVAAEEED